MKERRKVNRRQAHTIIGKLPGKKIILPGANVAPMPGLQQKLFT
jgi:hypothetical protein